MTIFQQLARVRLARAKVQLAREQVGEPAAALLARGCANPLTSVGLAAGVGVALGAANIHPLRLPGVASLLSGGVAELVTQGVRLFTATASGDADPS